MEAGCVLRPPLSALFPKSELAWPPAGTDLGASDNKMNVPAEAFNRCLFFELLHTSVIYEVSGMLLVLSNILDNIKFWA